MGELEERAKEKLFGMSATRVLLLFVAAFLVLAGTLAAIVSTIPPTSAIVRYAAFAILIFIIFISRTIEPWQWGLEVYQITIFTMALVFGMSVPIAVTLITFFLFPISWSISTPFDWYLTKNYIGPIVQTAVLFILSILGGLLNIFAYETAAANLPYYYLGSLFFADLVVGNYLRFKITPLPIYRIAVYNLIVIIVNYNLATIAGKNFLDLMTYLKG